MEILRRGWLYKPWDLFAGYGGGNRRSREEEAERKETERQTQMNIYE